MKFILSQLKSICSIVTNIYLSHFYLAGVICCNNQNDNWPEIVNYRSAWNILFSCAKYHYDLCRVQGGGYGLRTSQTVKIILTSSVKSTDEISVLSMQLTNYSKNRNSWKINNNEPNQIIFQYQYQNFQNCTTSLQNSFITIATTNIITANKHICSAPYTKPPCRHTVKLTSSPLRTVLSGILPIAFFAAHIKRLCFHAACTTS